MARNGSGTMTPSVDFTTEAASPPIEIAKLDTVLDDIASEITNSIAADGQTNPSADLKMNGFKHTNVAAATALTNYARVSELIDQDHIYYVDSGSANTMAITPSPAISAYEEGQRFVVRAAANNSGATTLNVNALGAIAVQTPDGSALVSGSIILGGLYEFTYDANATPDRWVLTSLPSNLPFSIAASDIARLSPSNTFTGAINTFSRAGDSNRIVLTETGSSVSAFFGIGTTHARVGTSTNHPFRAYTNDVLRFELSEGGNYDFKSGTVTTNNASASEVGYKGTPHQAQNGDYTLVLTDAGKTIYKASGGAGETITIPANASVAFPVGTAIDIVNNGGGTLTVAITSDTLSLAGVGTTGSRTLSDHGWCVLKKVSSTEWFISGTGLT